jgi:hypothetical protein
MLKTLKSSSSEVSIREVALEVDVECCMTWLNEVDGIEVTRKFLSFPVSSRLYEKNV